MSDQAPTDESPSRSDYIWGWVSGVAFIFFGMLGPRIVERWEWWSGYAGDSDAYRFLFAAVGFGIIAGTEGKKTQSTWRRDGGWSPRLIGHGLGALAAAIGCGVLAVLALAEAIGNQ